MTDLEKELTRQIHELSKELMALRERVAVLEVNAARVNHVVLPQHKDPYAPPYVVTCGTGVNSFTGMGGAGRE